MSEHPDSAELLLESTNLKRIKSRYNKARYALLYSQALDKNYIDVDRDTLIRVATDYYKYHGTKEHRALAFFYSGRVYENAGKIDSAILQYTTAEQYVNKTDDDYLKGLLASALAGLYATQQFRTLARDKYIEASEYFQKSGHKYNTLLSYMAIMSMSNLLDDYANATYYYEHAKKLANDLDDKQILQSLALSYASNVTSGTSDYESALTVLRQAYMQYNNGIVPKSYYFALGRIYVYLNQPDSAYLFLHEDVDQEMGRGNVEVSYLLGKVMEMRGNYKRAYQYSDRALSLLDSMYFSEKEQSIPEIKEKYHSEQLKSRNDFLRILTRYQFVVALLLIASLLFISLWLIGLRQKKILRQHQEIVQYQTVITKLQNEYDQLQSLQQNINNDDNLTHILAKRLNFLKNWLETTVAYEHDKELYYRKVKEFIADNTNKGNGIINIFRDILEAKCPGILEYLQKKYPNLSDSDVDLYCLMCLNLSVSAIGLVTRYKLKTVYNNRNQLRIKLDIQNNDVKIHEHFNRLCEEMSGQ
jgi:tetratricopeptide repeat protein